MTGPAWLAAALATAMLLIAAGSVVRLAIWRLRGRAAEPEVDVLHVLMGIAMAGMLEPRISPVPGDAWRLVFAAAAAWFACRAIRVRGQRHCAGGRQPAPGSWQCAHPAPHLVECAAMVYMLVPAGAAGHGPVMAMPGMAGAAPAANPALTFVLALFMLGYIVWTADRFRAREAEPDSAAGRTAAAALAPRAAACSRIAMSLAMGYMLLTML
jgi:hypothetical protein